MGIFFGSRNKNKLVLVFDVGSSGVGGALFRVKKSSPPEIIFSVNEPIPIEENFDIGRFFVLTLQTLEIVSNKIFRERAGAPDEIFCVLSSPWHASQTRIIRLEKNTPFNFNAKLATELIQKESALFKEQHFADSKEKKNKIHMIEIRNIKTILNGYETTHPLDQKAKELEMIVFISMSEEKILKKIESVISKHFFFERIKYCSLTMASFAVIREISKDNENFLLMNISGEITDIAMVKKGVLSESISFPVGSNFFAREFALNFKCSTNEASSLISLFLSDHANTKVARKVEPLLKDLGGKWLKKFQESLANLSNDISIPSKIYLSVDKEFSAFFKETIIREQFNQYTLTESKFNLVEINAELLHNMVQFKTESFRDPVLITESIYINNFLIK